MYIFPSLSTTKTGSTTGKLGDCAQEPGPSDYEYIGPWTSPRELENCPGKVGKVAT